MDTYSLLREIADSWVLLALFSFFIGCVVWAFWPSMRADRDAASQIPFRNEALGGDLPAAADSMTEPNNG
ncbi:MAG: cbb3-type cytochrome c oxidase subunit 3 [Pseudomonadota bacterium]